MTAPNHVPVLLEEVVGLLSPESGQIYADATAGLGGHAAVAAAAIGSEGIVVLTDADENNLNAARLNVEATFAGRVEVLHANFADLPRLLGDLGLAADLFLADLGFASVHVDDPSRGFSFRHDGPLDMRLDRSRGQTAEEMVNALSEVDLGSLIREFGEDRHWRRIARKLVEARDLEPITTTKRLAEIVRSACPGRGRQVIDPATRTFQALRIAVNDELGSLASLLDSIARAAVSVHEGKPTWLAPGARVAMIAFHSLEDRPVKHTFADLAGRELVTRLTRKPIRAGEDEVARNVRARSARLRAIRLAGD